MIQKFSDIFSKKAIVFLFCASFLFPLITFASDYSLSSSFTRTNIGINVSGKSSTKLYGVNQTNGHYTTSVDGTTWVDRTYSPSVYTPLSIQFVLDEPHNYMYVVSSDGKLYRATIDDFNHWTNVSPPNPGTTTGRPDIFTFNSQYLFYGNYNSNSIDGAHIYRSSDNGASWIEVLSETNGRHVHSIFVDPTNGANIFANIGDANNTSKGLWYSASNGDLGSWGHLSSNRYGIDITLQNDSNYKRLLFEGDGANQPPIMGYNYSQISTPSDTGIVVDTSVATSGASWVATTRGINLLNAGNLFFITTAEGGSVPGATRDGLWLARGDDFSDVTLLEEVTGSTWFYNKTYEFNGYVFNFNYRMVVPSFVRTLSSPSGLSQNKSNGTTAINSGGWTNETSITLKLNMFSVNGSDSLIPQIEIRPIGTSFTDTVTNTGNTVTYSGSPVTGEVIITGLTNGTTYHWQARISNGVGQSTWVAMGGNPDFGIDTSAPVPAVASRPGGHRQDISNLLAPVMSVSSSTTSVQNQTVIQNTNPSTSSEPSAYNFTHNLSLHATGADVKLLQQFLNTHGFPVATTGLGSPLNETTLFGPLTYKALVNYQQSVGLPATGWFGPMTRGVIQNMGK